MPAAPPPVADAVESVEPWSFVAPQPVTASGRGEDRSEGDAVKSHG